jgi:hypothetical protein
MKARVIGHALVLFIAWSRAASGQTILPREGPQARATVTLAVLASTSFTPYSLSGKLGESWITLSMQGVTIGPYEEKVRTVMLDPRFNPQVLLSSLYPDMPNGPYSVQFGFSQVARPSVVKLTGPTGAVITQCTLAQGPNTVSDPPQVCDSGVFQVTEKSLWVGLSIVQGEQLHLATITLNALQSPRMLR